MYVDHLVPFSYPMKSYAIAVPGSLNIALHTSHEACDGPLVYIRPFMLDGATSSLFG